MTIFFTYLKKFLNIVLFSAAVMLALKPAYILAQMEFEQENETQVEEITVTGQKREETLIESDIAVTVLDYEVIQDTRLRDLRRLDDLVPNVQFNESGQLSSVFVSIRGIESNPFIVNRAALYIDGIPFRELSNAILNQVDSIEVLRGPQSTLYGANSEAGLLLINTRQPEEKFQDEVRWTSTFFNGDQGHSMDGFVGGPISDTLGLSWAFKVQKEDSYISNPSSSTGEPGQVRDLFLQNRLTYRPNDDLTIKTTAYVLDTHAPGLFDQEYAPLDRSVYDRNYRNTFNNGRSVGKFEFLNDAPKLTDERDKVAGLSANYQLDYGELDFALSYSKLEKDSAGLDLDLTAANQFMLPNPCFGMPPSDTCPAAIIGLQTLTLGSFVGRDIEDETFWSGELRYTSPDSDVFEYLVGVSWYKEEKVQRLTTTGFNLATQAYNPYTITPPQTADGEDFAIFGSATAGLGIEGLSGTIGLRYDRAKRETKQQQGPPLNLGIQVLNFFDIQLEETFEELLPRFVLSYEASDDLNFYASASKGYIPGGFNLTLVNAGQAGDLASYDQETIWSYEAGAKMRYPDGKGYLNFAVFYIESDGWQEVRILTDDMGRVASSAFIGADADIESYGFEIETVYEPTYNLKLSASFGYTDATYKDFLFQFGQEGAAAMTIDLDGEPVKLVPEYDANLAARYEFDNGFFARGEVSFTGETPLDERSRAVRDSVAVFNLYAGYDWDHYSLLFFGENLFDERIETGLAFDHFLFGNDGTLYAPYDAPRIIGVELTAKF